MATLLLSFLDFDNNFPAIFIIFSLSWSQTNFRLVAIFPDINGRWSEYEQRPMVGGTKFDPSLIQKLKK